MRLLWLIVFAVVVLGCSHVELVRSPGVTDPSAPFAEAGLGIVRYQTRDQRTDAYLQMHDACAGPPEVVRESSEAGWHLLHFRCVGPPLPHGLDVPEDQKPCCWSVGQTCGELTCTCDPQWCPQQQQQQQQ